MKEIWLHPYVGGWTGTSHRHIINFLANSSAWTFFLDSFDASSETANAQMLVDLLEKQINKIGKEYVVQVAIESLTMESTSRQQR